MSEYKIRYFQKGFNFSQDGPGNRLVYHLCGCNFKCPWCSNPEGMELLDCDKEIDADECIAEILRSKPMFFGGGGVTFTGGEATLSFEALKYILSELSSRGISTAIETNASHPRLSELFPFIDCLMMDWKHSNPEKHKEILGASIGNVLKNLSLAAATRQCALRIPLINGYNTDDACIDGFVSYISALPKTENFTLELIAYHEYGKVKWEQNGKEYTVENGFVPPSRLAEIKKKFTEAGITLITT